MWTRENRSLYERKGLRYPSDLSDPEWALIEPLIPPAKRGGRKREVDVREVLNSMLYVLGTGCRLNQSQKRRSSAKTRAVLNAEPVNAGVKLHQMPE